MHIPEYVRTIIDRLENADESAYVVGGSLRDALLGLDPHDYDVATSALPEKTRSLFPDMHVYDTGIKHGTVTVVCQGHPIEVTTFRIDGSYTDSRHPDAVSFTDKISEDLSRRDFTVNAMAYSYVRGFVDIFGGQADLDARMIRAVRDPAERFTEDALRILRAFRFSAQLGFDIEPLTLAACGECKAGLAELSAERVCSELLRLLGSGSPSLPLSQMKALGILPYIFGEYSPSDKLIALLPKMQTAPAARLGFLLTDCEESHAKNILNSLKCSTKQKAAALAVRRGASFSAKDIRDAGRLKALAGIYSPFALRASVLLGNSPKDAELWLAESQAPTSIADLDISGKDVMALGAKGAEIGHILTALLDLAIEDPSINERTSLIKLAEEIHRKTHKTKLST